MRTVKINDKPKYVYFIEAEGERLEVQRDVQLERFQDKDVTLYEYEVTNKGGVTETKYCMSLAEYKANKPAPARISKDYIKSMLEQCLSAEEVLLKLVS